MTTRRLLGRLFAVVLVGAAVIFLAGTIADNADELRAFDWSVRPLLLVVSLVAHVLVLTWGVAVWQRVLRHTTTEPVGLLPLQRIWFVSTIARYIPGKIWQFVAAAQLATRAGLSGAAVLTSLAIQIGFTLLAAVMLASATVPVPEDWPIGRTHLVAAAFVGSMLLAHPAVLRGALRLIPRALHRDVLDWKGTWADGIVVLALSMVSWLLYGCAFWLFVASLVPIEAAALLPLAGVNALSFLAGYLVFVAPAGLGAREFAMTNLLAPLIPEYVAAVVAILSRLWTVAAELIGAGVLLALPLAGTRLDPDADPLDRSDLR